MNNYLLLFFQCSIIATYRPVPNNFNTFYLNKHNPTCLFNLNDNLNQPIHNPTNLEKEFDQSLESANYENAFQMIKRNPMLPIMKHQAIDLLNNLDKIDPIEKTQSSSDSIKLTESCVFLYKRLERQSVFTGFGCIENEYPEKSSDITPQKLEQLSGLSMAALTPRERTSYWRLAGVALCLSEFFLGRSIGIDPLTTIIPGTFLLFGIDQIIYKGAYFESFYRKLFPEYKKKIITHEAGHFFLAYLLGIPIRGVVTNAWEARKYPEIRGQAGTIFFDPKLSDEVSNQKVTRNSLDRLSVVLMAGIAAEALKFSKAEGGASDEQTLVGFFNSIQPPWNMIRIQSQARWAVLQALLLLKEHEEAFNATIEAIEQEKGVGDIIKDIERALPSPLPSAQRIEERKTKNKQREIDAILRYIQKKTYEVNGILNENSVFVREDGNESSDELTSIPTEITGAVDEIIQTTLDNSNDEVDPTNRKSKTNPPGDYQKFIEKMKLLEKAVATGDLNLTKSNNAPSGGIWLNDLQALKTTVPGTLFRSNTNETVVSELVLPVPIEGYEERIKKLAAETDSFVDESTDEDVVHTLLTSHRGYQMKQLELIEQYQDMKVVEIDERLEQLKTNQSSSQKQYSYK